MPRKIWRICGLEISPTHAMGALWKALLQNGVVRNWSDLDSITPQQVVDSITLDDLKGVRMCGETSITGITDALLRAGVKPRWEWPERKALRLTSPAAVTIPRRVRLPETHTVKPPSANGGIEPEFVRVPDLAKLFGIRRGLAYSLINGGKIKSVALRRKGAKTGVRLVHVASVREYLQSQML